MAIRVLPGSPERWVIDTGRAGADLPGDAVITRYNGGLPPNSAEGGCEGPCAAPAASGAAGALGRVAGLDRDDAEQRRALVFRAIEATVNILGGPAAAQALALRDTADRATAALISSPIAVDRPGSNAPISAHLRPRTRS